MLGGASGELGEEWYGFGRVRDRLLIAMLLLMGADLEARNAEGITPEKAMRFNPGGGVAMRMDLLVGPRAVGGSSCQQDPRIGGRGYLEGLYGRVVKPGGARVGEGDGKELLVGVLGAVLDGVRMLVTGERLFW